MRNSDYIVKELCYSRREINEAKLFYFTFGFCFGLCFMVASMMINS